MSGKLLLMEGMQIPLQSWWKLSENTRCGWITNAFLKSGFVQYNRRPKWKCSLKVWTIMIEVNYEQLMQEWDKHVHMTNRYKPTIQNKWALYFQRAELMFVYWTCPMNINHTNYNNNESLWVFHGKKYLLCISTALIQLSFLPSDCFNTVHML